MDRVIIPTNGESVATLRFVESPGGNNMFVFDGPVRTGYSFTSFPGDNLPIVSIARHFLEYLDELISCLGAMYLGILVKKMQTA